MFSDAAAEAMAAYDALDAAIDAVAAVPYEALTTREQLNLLARRENAARRLPAGGHALLNLVAEHAVPADIGGPVVRCWRIGCASPGARRRAG